MKNIVKYMMAAVAGMGVLAACEQLEDFQTTIDAPDVLVYSQQAGSANVHTTKIAHAPVGSFGSYDAIFPVTCNSGSHKATTVKVTYDADAAQAYKDEKKLEHSILPAEFLSITKYVAGAEATASSEALLTLPEDARSTTDSVRVALTGDLSKLTEKQYIAALKISSDAFEGSEVMGTYYLEVLTEKNCIRPLTSMDEMAGKTADRSGWEYIEGLSGDVSSRKSLPGEPLTVVVDMKQNYIVTGVRFGLYSSWGGIPTFSAIEYSTDGQAWEQAGSPDQNGLTTDDAVNVAFYGYIEARYIKFTADATNVSSWYRYLNDFNIYCAAGKEPTLYLQCGEDNTFTGMVKHTPAGSTSNVDYSFPVRVAPSGTSAINATVAVDNSLIAAYNEANGTSYKELPAGNVTVEYGSVTIGGGAVKSDDVHVAVTGDLASLKEPFGYLIPLSLKSSAHVDETANVVYVIVKVVESKLKSIESLEDIDGSLASDRTGWSITGEGQNMNSAIDGNTGSYATNFPRQNDNVLTLDLGAVKDVTGVMVTSMYYAPTITLIETSTDGSNFVSCGVPGEGEYLNVGSGWSQDQVHVGFAGAIKAQYVRITINFAYSYSYYQRVGEMNVYLQ